MPTPYWIYRQGRIRRQWRAAAPTDTPVTLGTLRLATRGGTEPAVDSTFVYWLDVAADGSHGTVVRYTKVDGRSLEYEIAGPGIFSLHVDVLGQVYVIGARTVHRLRVAGGAFVEDCGWDTGQAQALTVSHTSGALGEARAGGGMGSRAPPPWVRSHRSLTIERSCPTAISLLIEMTVDRPTCIGSNGGPTSPPGLRARRWRAARRPSLDGYGPGGFEMPGGMVSTGSHLYWTTGQRIRRIPVESTGIDFVADGPGLR